MKEPASSRIVSLQKNFKRFLHLYVANRCGVCVCPSGLSVPVAQFC